MKQQLCEIEIKKLRLRTIIGFNDWERVTPQDVVISVKFRYDAAKAISSDDVSGAINYRTITKKIIEKVEKSDFNLVESLTNMVFELVSSTPGVIGTSVTVEKPQALRYVDNLISKISDYE